MLCLSTVSGHALADEYTVAIGTPLLGTSIPPGRVGLGIAVSVDKSWAELSEVEQGVWRAYTELEDPQITPPFPQPNIRGFLRKLSYLPQYDDGEAKLAQRDEIFLIVRVSDSGDVGTVEIMRGANATAKELSPAENILAYRYIKALLATKFTPALLNGKPVASAFPLLVCQVTVLR